MTPHILSVHSITIWQYINDSLHPIIISSLNTGSGLLGIDVAYDFESTNLMAYVANNKTSQQLLVINLDVGNNFTNPFIESLADLQPAPLGINSQPTSIFIKQLFAIF